MNIEILPILTDNYTYILKGNNSEIGIVDPGEAPPVIEFLDKNNLKPSIIFNTHHHGDHIAGNNEIIKRYRCNLAAPAIEPRIKHVDIRLAEGTIFSFGDEDIHIFETPGQTSGHICLYFPKSRVLFSGDTLFSMGCGRLFEGTPAIMWDSLQKLIKLPDETRIYCGHEYTINNGKFCAHIEPENADIKKRMIAVETLRAESRPSLPSTIGLEKKTNVFLRAGSSEKFGELRALKDLF
jgi:hydroxyacylglutathione hydrolase